MRILLIHPNCHSRGAEIAANWPPAWVAYLMGCLKAAAEVAEAACQANGDAVCTLMPRW